MVDVVVIGGGVIGCSIAFHLARQPGMRVLVVEKGSIASGMTKRSGGLVRTYFSFEPEARLALTSLRYFQNWNEMVGGNGTFTPTGLVVVAGEENAPDLKANVARLRGIGANMLTLSPAELKELQPTVQVEDVALAAFEPDSGYLDSVAATQALAARAKARGAIFHTGTFVKSILVERGRVTGVDTTSGPIEALTVVLAAGPWSDRLLKPLGLEIGIRTETSQVAFFERPPDLKNGHAAFLDLITGAYFRPHTYGLCLGGLIAQDAEPQPNPDQFDEMVDPAFVGDVQRRVAARLPAMAKARFVRGHTGVYDMSPDAHPVLDRVPGIHGLVIAAGFSGLGFGWAPAVGACIAELVTDGAASTVDLLPFRFSRFQGE